MKYLVEQHSLQVVPGALSLIGYLTGASRGFRGVSDRDAGKKSEHDNSTAVDHSKADRSEQRNVFGYQAYQVYHVHQGTGGSR